MACDDDVKSGDDTGCMKIPTPVYVPRPVPTNPTANLKADPSPAKKPDVLAHDAPLAPDTPRQVTAKVSLSSEESLLGLRASARLPRFSPVLSLDVHPGVRIEAGVHCKASGYSHSISGNKIAIYALSANEIVLENVTTNTQNDVEDVILSKTPTGAFVGKARNGEWHLLPPDRVGVRRLSYIPNLVGADYLSTTTQLPNYVDISLARIDLARDLQDLDGLNVRAVSSNGTSLTFLAAITDDILTFTSSDGDTLTFDSNQPYVDGLAFLAQENTLFQNAHVGFDTASGEYRLKLMQGGQVYEAKLSLPVRMPRQPEAYRVLHQDAQGTNSVTLAEQISLDDGRAAIRFASKPSNTMPSMIFVEGGLAVDESGQPVGLTRNGANLTLTLPASQLTIELQNIAPGTDLARFNNQQGSATIVGPTGHDISGEPLPGVADTEIKLAFAAQAFDEHTWVDVKAPGHGLQDSLVRADGFGGFPFSTAWAKYRITPRTDGAYDMESSWFNGALRSKTIIQLG